MAGSVAPPTAHSNHPLSSRVSLQTFYAQLTLTMMCKMRFYVFVMAGAFCLALVAFTIAFVPETKGLHLERCVLVPPVLMLFQACWAVCRAGWR